MEGWDATATDSGGGLSIINGVDNIWVYVVR
jgi:hypothetical protein